MEEYECIKCGKYWYSSTDEDKIGNCNSCGGKLYRTRDPKNIHNNELPKSSSLIKKIKELFIEIFFKITD